MVIYKDKILFSAFLASLIMLVISFSLIYINFLDIKNLLIIHFDAFSGIDFLGGKWDVYKILITGIYLNILNFFLSLVLYFKEKFLSYLLGFAGSFISLLIFLIIWVIVAVN